MHDSLQNIVTIDNPTEFVETINSTKNNTIYELRLPHQEPLDTEENIHKEVLKVFDEYLVTGIYCDIDVFAEFEDKEPYLFLLQHYPS